MIIVIGDRFVALIKNGHPKKNMKQIFQEQYLFHNSVKVSGFETYLYNSPCVWRRDARIFIDVGSGPFKEMVEIGPRLSPRLLSFHNMGYPLLHYSLSSIIFLTWKQDYFSLRFCPSPQVKEGRRRTFPPLQRIETHPHSSGALPMVNLSWNELQQFIFYFTIWAFSVIKWAICFCFRGVKRLYVASFQLCQSFLSLFSFKSSSCVHLHSTFV